MARLPRLSGREVVKAFGRLGWEQATKKIATALLYQASAFQNGGEDDNIVISRTF